MIRLVEMECPNCGGTLTRTDKTSAKCSHCGAEFLIDNGEPKQVTVVYGAGSRQPEEKYVRIIILAIFLPVILFTAFCFAVRPRHTSSNAAEEGYMTEDFSDFFQYFSMEVYDVPPEEVTAEQLSKIDYLRISYSRDKITLEYSMENGSIQSIDIPNKAASYYADLNRFTGLHTLDLPNHELSEISIPDLTELTEIRTRNSPEELARIVSCPEKIKVLYSYDASSLAGIDVFSNLEQLSLECSDNLSDINSISALKQLKSLTIKDGDSITDFGVLQSLPGLEELSIDSEGLKDISFLQHLTALKTLDISNSILLDISPIGYLTSLTELCLENNNEVTDYSVLANLNSLNTLTLDIGSNASVPAMENLSSLTSLSLYRAENIGFLSSLPSLRHLCLSGCNFSEYMVLADLQNLEILKISNIYGDVKDLKVLNSLPALRALDISSLEFYGNVEYLFGIPCLEELNINDCSFGLDFAAMPENPNLKRLSMNRIELWENISVEYNGPITNLSYDNVNLADVIGFVEKFPNLEELYLQSDKLTEVAFAESLPNLKKIDITDNYVTDLRPLSKLQYLDTVWCGGNTISHGLDLGENVTVISDSEGETAW